MTSVTPTPHPTDTGPIRLADFGYFFVGGEYVQTGSGEVLSGGMYVERYVPETVTATHPVVLVHGNWQTGNNFTGTPDGRRGWAHDFLRAGYTVYVVDQPGRGRSGEAGGIHGPRVGKTVEFVERRFTGIAPADLWPQAAKHTQWPGTGLKGDADFDRHYASQVESLTDRAATERLNLAANLALADRIGTAIWLTHSQAGPFGLALADARPEMVAALLSIEPNGPSFHDCLTLGAPDWFAPSSEVLRHWGVAAIPLTFEPPVNGPGEMKPVEEAEPDRQDFVRCFLQAEPARQLVRLKGVRHAILAAEASYHAAYDHCTAKFLAQAGAPADLIRLEEHGIHGNGHMMMLEKNNHEIADLMLGWLKDKGL